MAASVIYAVDSFKTYTSLTTDIFTYRWTRPGNATNPFQNFALNATGGRFGGQSMRQNFTGAAGGNTLWTWLGGNRSTLCVSIPLRVNQQNANNAILTLADVGTGQICLALNATTGALEVRKNWSGGSLFGSSSPLHVNTYYMVELKITFSATVGTIELRINPQSPTDTSSDVINLTGQNTIQTANAYANFLVFGADQNNCAQIDFEHIMVMDDFLGDCRIYQRFPNSDSAVAWTKSTGVTNFGNVNEAQESGDTGYNSSSTVGQVDLFGFPATPPGLGSIFAVMLESYARKDDAGARTFCNEYKSGVTQGNGATQDPNTTYQEFVDFLYVDPNTSAAFTQANLDALLSGYKLLS